MVICSFIFGYPYAFYVCWRPLFHKASGRKFLICFLVLLQTFIFVEPLKKIFKIGRPEGACSTTYGMPSGHSCFVVSMATWYILEMINFDNKAPFKQTFGYKFEKYLMFIVCLLVPFSRVYLNYHTIN